MKKMKNIAFALSVAVLISFGIMGCPNNTLVTSPNPLPFATATFSPTVTTSPSPNSSSPAPTFSFTPSAAQSNTPIPTQTATPGNSYTATMTITNNPTQTSTPCSNPYLAAIPPVACAITPIAFTGPAYDVYSFYSLYPGCQSTCSNKVYISASDLHHYYGKFSVVAAPGDTTYSTAEWRHFFFTSCVSNQSNLAFDGEGSNQYAIVTNACSGSPVTQVVTGTHFIWEGYNNFYSTDLAVCQVSGPPGCFVITTYCGGTPTGTATNSPTPTATPTPTVTP